MTAPSIRARVVVIGGGVLGVSTATQLVRQGADVTLLTEGELASGASGRSLSWLNTAGLRSPEYHALRQLGIDRYRTLAAREDVSAFLRFDGGLTWAPEGESYRPILDHERSIGYDAKWVTADEVAAVTPGVDPAAIASEGAIFNPGEGWVDLPSLIHHLATEFTARGGELITGAGHVEVVVEDGRAVGALLPDGRRFAAEAVLLATGPGVPAQVAEHGVVIEDASPAALLVWTKPVDTALTAPLRLRLADILHGLDDHFTRIGTTLDLDRTARELADGIVPIARRHARPVDHRGVDDMGAGDDLHVLAVEIARVAHHVRRDLLGDEPGDGLPQLLVLLAERRQDRPPARVLDHGHGDDTNAAPPRPRGHPAGPPG